MGLNHGEYDYLYNENENYASVRPVFFSYYYYFYLYLPFCIIFITLQWSYGITLWEIMTRGSKPYHTVANTEVEKFLLRGGRLAKEEDTPQEV